MPRDETNGGESDEGTLEILALATLPVVVPIECGLSTSEHDKPDPAEVKKLFTHP